MKTAVFVQYSGIGDLVWHLGYLQAIAESSQSGRVSVIAQPSTFARSLLAGEAWVDEVIDHQHSRRAGRVSTQSHAGVRGILKLAATVRARQFDRIVIFGPHHTRALVAWLAGVPHRIGFGYRLSQRLWLNRGPFIAPYAGEAVGAFHEATALMQAHGFCEGPLAPRLHIASTSQVHARERWQMDGAPLVAMAIGTSLPEKQWGAANFAALANLCAAQGFGVVLLGGPAEQALGQAILQGVDERHLARVKVVTDASMRDVAELLSIAQVCTGNDTGVTNLAAAVGCPTYVILGHRKPLTHDPVNFHNLRASSLMALTPEAVWAQVSPAMSLASSTSHMA